MTSQELAKAMAAVVKDYVKAAVAPLSAQLEAQTKEIATLKAAPTLKYCGVWKGGTFQPGDAITYQGALWVCKAETSGCPGVDFVGWQLAVKKGSA